MTTARIAVVGGGITGLVAAVTLIQRGEDVVVLEAAGHVGGKIRASNRFGVPIELGADAFLPRDEGPLRLCAELGLTDALVEPAAFGALVWTARGLRRMPPNVLGVPTSPLRAAGGFLSAKGAIRAFVGDQVRAPLKGPDVSVGEFVARRFGTEVLGSMVDPMLAGTRAGDPHSMSLSAALPEVDTAARSGRRIGASLRRRRSIPTFYSLEGGLSRLTHALGDYLGGRVRTSTPVTSIREIGAGYRLEIQGEETIDVDGVIVALPAPLAARVTSSLDDEASSLLGRIKFASAAVVVLRFAPGAFDVPEGVSGILVPSHMDRTLSACTFYSLKWPSTAPPDGSLLIRCFVGRGLERREGELQESDESLVHRVTLDLNAAMGGRAHARDWLVQRWPGALPRLEVGHEGLVDRIEARLRGRPVAVAGAGYRGTGIPDCIRAARAAAAIVAAELAGRRRR